MKNVINIDERIRNGKRIVLISDIHLGKNRICPKITYRNIKKFLYPALKNCDLLIVAGDFWDKLLYLNTLAARIGLTIAYDLHELSVKHNFIIRILDGTFDHDRKQNKFFERPDFKNLKVVDSMLIEDIDGIGAVGYIPDDLPIEHVQQEFIQLLKTTRDIPKIDILVLHGYCEHELPKGMIKKPFNVFNINTLKKYARLIVKGHIHTKSVYENTINNGSFERCAHNENESKGFFIIDMYDDSKIVHSFVENTDTYIFKSIMINDEENPITQINYKVRRILERITDLTPLPIYIQIKCSSSNKTKIDISSLDFDVPIKYTFKITDEKYETSDTETTFVCDELPIINEDNLNNMLELYLNGALCKDEIKKLMDIS